MADVNVGGYGDEQRSDVEVQALVDNNPEMRKAVQRATNGNDPGHMTSLTYRTQVVAGTNYIVKVLTENKEYFLLLIFQPLPYTKEQPTLTSLQVTSPIPTF
ncbi:stefin-C-like [Mytilus californianus]|uniref:stefin-C-like n=1 Tax=Mytilus californianus TaxID=6549 RepID=UPI0022466F4E|nr:stefin-C-like [Mytilus californianus]